MNLTLHLTTDCNMRCSYCYSPPPEIASEMTSSTAVAAIEMAARMSKDSSGIVFFGGEPLLRLKLIKAVILRARDLEQSMGIRFHFKITTNGLLVNESFLDYAVKEDIFVGVSIDGIQEVHDKHRVTATGEGTFHILDKNIDLLLERRPYSMALMVITPETVNNLYNSVDFLFNKGFRYIICSPNYAGKWHPNHIKTLAAQYRKLAKLYEHKTRKQEKFYLSPFEVKLSSHINSPYYEDERCELGMRQLSIGVDGSVFPCTQFTKDHEFAIGHVLEGINEQKRSQLFLCSRTTKEPCQSCAMETRCNNTCGCLNWQTTGYVDQVSPVLCAHERTLLPIADSLGKRLFKQKAPMFIQKHYNSLYPYLSMLDDIVGNEKNAQL